MREFEFGGQKFNAYLVEPKSKAKGGIIVIHEIWGLQDHIKAVANRFAAEGYIALAPDLLSETDITAHATPELQEDLFNPEKRNKAQPKMRALMTPLSEPDFGQKTLGKAKVCFDYLYSLPGVNKRVAANGFCFGGSYSFSLAMYEPRLRLALPFYGHADISEPETLKHIRCPIRAFYGEKDENLMRDLPALQKAMKTAGVDFEATVYPGCGHAFFNDTNKFAYDRAAATDAWHRVLDSLTKYMVP